MRLWTKTIDINFFTVRKQLKHFVIYHAQTRDTCREMKVWSNVRSLSRSRRLSRSKQKIVWPSCWTKKAERMIALNERERGQGRSKKSEWYRPYIAKGLNWKRKGRNSEVVQEVLSIIFIQNLHSNHHLKKRGKLSGWVRAGWAGCERANRKDNNNKKNINIKKLALCEETRTLFCLRASTIQKISGKSRRSRRNTKNNTRWTLTWAHLTSKKSLKTMAI